MVGNYKIGDLEVTNPTVELVSLKYNYESDTVDVQVFIHDDNDGGNINIPEPNEVVNMPSSINKNAIQSWLENYLQRFKI